MYISQRLPGTGLLLFMILKHRSVPLTHNIGHIILLLIIFKSVLASWKCRPRQNVYYKL